MVYCQREKKKKVVQMAWDGEGTQRGRLAVSSKVAGAPHHSGMGERKVLSQGWMLREDLTPHHCWSFLAQP